MAVREINNFALIEKSVYSNVNLDFILAINSFASIHGVEDAIYNQSVYCYPCIEPTPSHVKQSMTSIALKMPGKFVLKALQSTLDEIVYTLNNMDNEIVSKHTSAMKIYRMKGLLHISGQTHLHVLQAVHNIFDLQQSDYLIGGLEDKTQGLNLIIVIGTNLDAETLESKFRHCIEISK